MMPLQKATRAALVATALLFATLFAIRSEAHNVDLAPIAVREWHMIGGAETIRGSYLLMNGDEVAIETESGAVRRVPLASLSPSDQAFAIARRDRIARLNTQPAQPITPKPTSAFRMPDASRLAAVAFFLATLAFFAIRGSRNAARTRTLRYALGAGVAALIVSFTPRPLQLLQVTTSPTAIDSAFAPFKPRVVTSWDNQWFYVQSQGIPLHPMMKGITGWQQQVPIPQCYTGTNAWQIPLQPTIAATVTPVDQVNFTRGAIAIAVNGVCIFDPYTNTGVDALVDGQLDQWGGHCGRADDYHYHIAPLHLYGSTSQTLPVAYAFDGFAVYGSVEPDGTPMLPLDANHGHYGAKGVYHYHGTTTAPYMIKNFVGKVTQDSTHQLVPQPHAQPVRPAGTPLKGAVITDCSPNGTNNGYVLTYTLNNQTYKVDYSWTQAGTYTFKFIDPSNNVTTNTYHGFTPCQLVAAVSEVRAGSREVTLMPNPSHTSVTVSLGDGLAAEEIKSIEVISTSGVSMARVTGYHETLSTRTLARGTYMVLVRTTGTTGSTSDKVIARKLVVE